MVILDTSNARPWPGIQRIGPKVQSSIQESDASILKGTGAGLCVRQYQPSVSSIFKAAHHEQLLSSIQFNSTRNAGF